MNIGLVCGGYPPGFDAIGAYTWWLGKALLEMGIANVTVFTRFGSVESSDGVEIVQFYNQGDPSSFLGLSAALESLPESRFPDWVILQYNPFMYGKRGFCPWVVTALKRLRSRPRTPRLAVMFHETFTHEDGIKADLMRLYQRRIAKRLVSRADVAFFSCEAYRNDFGISTGNRHLLAVGSNLPRSPLSKVEARARLQCNPGEVILGSFGTAHASHNHELIKQCIEYLMKAGLRVRFILAGVGSREVWNKMGNLPGGAIGELSPEDAADFINGLDLALLPYTDGISTRRGSAISAFQQGTPVLTTDGFATDFILRGQQGKALSLVPIGSPDMYAKAALDIATHKNNLSHMAIAARKFYEEMFSWEVIAKSLISKINI